METIDKFTETPQEGEKFRQPDGRGINATAPSKIPFKGWLDILVRVKDQIEHDNIGMVSAGVAFYSLLAIFPALSAVVGTFGLIFDQSDVVLNLTSLVGVLPDEASELVLSQLSSITESNDRSLSISVALGLLIAIWSATKGIKAIISALNIVYGEKERRGFIKLNLIAFVFTVSGVLFMTLALITVVIIPTILAYLQESTWITLAVSILRWPIIAAVVVLALSAVYRFAPSRRQAKWRWVSPGSVVATILWLLGSWVFSFYVTNFGSYNEVYGSIGAVIVLLMWFFVSTWTVLLGAEINAEIEHQTGMDTTVGRPKPIGKRGAFVADSIGERRD